MPTNLQDLIRAYESVNASITTLKDKYEYLLDVMNSHRHLGYDQTSPLEFGRVPLQDAATIATNCKLGSHFYATLAGNRTLANPDNARDAQRIVFELIQDATGSRTITLGSKFSAGPWTITLTTTASKRDFIECVYSSEADKFYITNFQKGY